MALNLRRNETKNGAFKMKSTLGPTGADEICAAPPSDAASIFGGRLKWGCEHRKSITLVTSELRVFIGRSFVGLGEKSTRLSTLRGASSTAQKQPTKYPKKLVFSNRENVFIVIIIFNLFTRISTTGMDNHSSSEFPKGGGGGGG